MTAVDLEAGTIEHLDFAPPCRVNVPCDNAAEWMLWYGPKGCTCKLSTTICTHHLGVVTSPPQSLLIIACAKCGQVGRIKISYEPLTKRAS